MVKPTVIGNDRHVGLEEPSPDVTRDNPSGSLDINLPPKRDFFNFETFEKTLSPEEMSTVIDSQIKLCSIGCMYSFNKRMC
jgi:hypothetical protein